MLKDKAGLSGAMHPARNLKCATSPEKPRLACIQQRDLASYRSLRSQTPVIKEL